MGFPRSARPIRRAGAEAKPKKSVNASASHRRSRRQEADASAPAFSNFTPGKSPVARPAPAELSGSGRSVGSGLPSYIRSRGYTRVSAGAVAGCFMSAVFGPFASPGSTGTRSVMGATFPPLAFAALAPKSSG